MIEKRTGIRLKLHEPPYHLDLDSFELEAGRLAQAALLLRDATTRLKTTSEERERIEQMHSEAMREFRRARTAFEIARGEMAQIEAGGVASAIKAMPLPDTPERST